MKIECQYMELGKSLFLAGTNYGDKLKEKCGKGSLKIFWDSIERRAEVHDSRGYYTYITEPWVFTYEPKQTEIIEPKNNSHAMKLSISKDAQLTGPDLKTAQVSTPEQTANRRPGRPPKFQGDA